MEKKQIILPLLVLSSVVLAACQPTPSSSNISNSEIETSDVEKPTSSEENPTSSETEKPTSSEEKPSSSELNENEVTYNTPASDAVEITIRQLLDIPKSRVDGTLYRVTGTMQYVQNEKYGNFDLTDSTGSITVWGTSKSKSSISGSGKNHRFSNPQDFSAMGLHGGDTVTMEVVHTVYGNNDHYLTPEIQGYVTKATKRNIWDIQPLSYTANDNYTGNYYSSIGDATGDTLGLKLHDLMINTHTSNVSYNSLKNHFKKTDSKNGTVVDFYTEKSVGSSGNLNREHVWPQSLSNETWGETGGGSDIHHLRACIDRVNSTRGNRRFAPAFNKQALSKMDNVRGGANYYSADHTTVGIWEPADCIKGDVARIIAYTFVHYTTSYGGKTNPTTNKLYLNDVMGVGKNEVNDLMRRWNAMDPVDDYEIHRNEECFKLQHNRNPFIDHPSYMDKLFK